MLSLGYWKDSEAKIFTDKNEWLYSELKIWAMFWANVWAVGSDLGMFIERWRLRLWKCLISNSKRLGRKKGDIFFLVCGAQIAESEKGFIQYTSLGPNYVPGIELELWLGTRQYPILINIKLAVY